MYRKQFLDEVAAVDKMGLSISETLLIQTALTVREFFYDMRPNKAFADMDLDDIIELMRRAGGSH